jgi:uncharacterized protein (TIGR02001 family)
MKKTLTTIAVATLMASSGMAMAEVEFSGNVALTTDYVFRGISQTDGPAVQGGFDMEVSNGLYAGIWASNLDFGDDADIEVDYYAGFGGEFANKLGYDVGVTYYSYPSSNAADAGDYDFTEVYGSLSYDFGPAAATLGLNHSSDYFGGSDNATYVYVGVDVPLANDFALSMQYGDQSIDDNAAFGTPDYNDWKVGLSKSVGGFDFALDYTDTDLSDAECFGGSDLCDDRFIFTISKSL